MSDVLAVDGLEVRCIVGVYPTERHVPQPLVVDLAVTLDTRSAAASERLHATIDYAKTAEVVRFVLSSSRFDLLETAADVLCRVLLLPPLASEAHPPAERARVRLTKPFAVPGARASLTIERSAAEARCVVEETAFGSVDVVHAGGSTQVERVRLAPRARISAHTSRGDVALMALTDAPLLGGRRGAVRPRVFEAETVRVLENDSDEDQALFAVMRPAFPFSDFLVPEVVSSSLR